jgi:1-acyl-sn-glycerol-3-phosphate acyltransferase
MSNSWRRPGLTGAILYAVAASVVSGLVTVISRLQVAQHRGRRAVATRLPPGGIIVISNHTSYADGVLLALVCRRLGRSLRLLATAGVFRAPVIGALARRLGFIPVERGAATAGHSLDAAAQAIGAGEAVGIFPEGRLTRDPDHWPERAKTGAVRLALRTGAPIVPVAMVGAHAVMGRSGFARQLLSNLILRPRVQARVGTPIDVRKLLTDPTDTEQIRQAADLVMAELIDLVESVRGEIAPAPTGVPPVGDALPDLPDTTKSDVMAEPSRRSLRSRSWRRVREWRRRSN